MKINYRDCKFVEADERNVGTKDNPDYEWIYYCWHPKNICGRCYLANQNGDGKKDCSLLDIKPQ